MDKIVDINNIRDKEIRNFMKNMKHIDDDDSELYLDLLSEKKRRRTRKIKKNKKYKKISLGSSL